MPIYEYRCKDCNHETELLVYGDEKVTCPNCESKQLEKLLSVIASPNVQTQSSAPCQPRPSGGCGLPQCGQGGCHQ